MSIDDSMHSLFGVSKAAADLMVQEYGRYFDMPTVCFRGGCLTGPNHAGAQLHGFLAYLMRCTVTGEPYTVFGYGGEAGARQHPQRRRRARVRGVPPAPRGRRPSTTSAAAARATARCSRRSSSASRSPAASWTGSSSDQARMGDHRWWISDLRRVPGATIRTGSSSTTSRRCCARSTSGTWSNGRPLVVKLSVVIPAHNEEGSIERDDRRPRRRSRRREDRLRDPGRRRLEHRPDAARSSSTSARELRESATTAPLPARLRASRSAPGSMSSTVTRSRS